MLRPMRDEWDMEFAGSGPEALAALERAPVDVLVTDLRMPGMNGVELLKETARRYPQTTRLILSGYVDEELTTDGRTVAHQFIAKPCSPDVLKAAVARALATDACGSIAPTGSRTSSSPSSPSSA